MSSDDRTTSIFPFRLSVRTALLALSGLAFVLGGVLVFDVYQDWIVEGNALGSTLLENGLPLLLILGVPVVGWKLAQRRTTTDLSEAATWALAGFVGTLVFAGGVLVLQVAQGRLKVWVLLTHLAVMGTIAGLFVGVQVARERRARTALRDREARLRALANSLPGVVFQFYARPDGTYGLHFVSEHAEEVLGIPAEADAFFEQFVERVPASHREAYLRSIDEAVAAGEPWENEIPYDSPDGERLWLYGRSIPEPQGDPLVFNGVLIDITDRKVAEETVREERDRFATLFHNLPTPVVHGVATEEGRIRVRDVNDAFESVFGYTDSEIQGADIQKLIVPAGGEGGAQSIRRRLLAGQTVDREVQRTAADGLRHFRVQVALRQGRDGQPEDGYAIYTDITDRKEAEQELQRTTQLLEKTLESLNEAVLVVDPSERTIVTCNAAVEQVFGYQKEELIGASTARLHVTPEAHERFADLSEPALDAEGGFVSEYQMRRKDGRVIETEHVVTPLESEEWPQGVVSVVRDITERKRQERELRQKERRYQAVFEDPNILVALVDPDGTVRNINQTAMRFVDAPLEDLRGQPFWETPWFAGDASIQRKMRRWIERAAHGEYVGFEIDHTQAVGEPLEVSGVVRPVRGEQQEVASLLVSARDVTTQKEHERALVEAKEAAEEAARLKSALLANMSHEIRTPLTSIIGFSELLSERLDDERAQFNERIQKSGHRLMKTLNSVLEFSQLEAGGQSLRVTTVCLVEVAREAVEMLRPRAQEKEIVLRMKCSGTEEVEGRWNEEALHRIAGNLLGNALKFTPAGGQVMAHVWAEETEAVLEVEDTGVGISEAALPDIFDAFKQESEGLRREYEGSGLGLSIVDQLVQGMGGRIEVESEKGEGSRFIVRLPRSDARTPR